MKWTRLLLSVFAEVAKEQPGTIDRHSVAVNHTSSFTQPLKTLRDQVFPKRKALPWNGDYKDYKFKVVESKGDYRDELFLENHRMPLYAHQRHFPRLPVPDVKDTLDKFLPTALPLAESEEEIANLKKAVEDFSEQAKVLQQRLHQRDYDTPTTSWIQDWWNKLAYLEYRDPVVIFVSYFFRILNDPTLPKRDPCTARGAALIKAAVPYAYDIYTGKKEPQAFGKKHKKVLCSSSHKYLFNTCRVPKPVSDISRVYWGPPQHAIVAVQGQFFSIPLSKDITRDQYQALLQECIDEAKQTKTKGSNKLIKQLGFLTSWNRDDWAHAYQVLQKHPEMVKALRLMESGAFVVCLDIDDAPHSDDEQCNLWWHGLGPSSRRHHCYNRWNDKSGQLAITKNGELGYVGEHSMMDGLPAMEFCQYLEENGLYSKCDEVEGVSESSIPPPPILKPKDIFHDAIESLSDAEAKEIQKLVDDARHDFTKLVDTYEMHCENFKGYGAKLIKKMGFAPDPFAQMVIQLAAHRLIGKQVGTYESTQVRSFLHGRTETTRTVSPDSAAFVKAMTTYSSQEKKEKRKELFELLLKATHSHHEYTMDAASGKGVDRHFFGLSCLVKGDDEKPDLFSDPVFIRSKTFRLSTSSLPVQPGFGPVADNGLGIGYALKPDSCIFIVSSRKENRYAKKMCHYIDEALLELKTLFENMED